MAEMRVYLDDMRDEPEGWVRTYTVPETIELLKTGEVVELSLDHDLGTFFVTGYHVLTWIEDQIVESGFQPPKDIHIHTANPVGRKYMELALRRIRELSKK